MTDSGNNVQTAAARRTLFWLWVGSVLIWLLVATVNSLSANWLVASLSAFMVAASCAMAYRHRALKERKPAAQ